LILRTASALRKAKIAAPAVVRAIGSLRASIPPGSVLATLALGAAASNLPMWDDGSVEPSAQGARAHWHPVRSADAALAELHFVRGHNLEDSDTEAARAAYLDALRADRDHLEARINLGRLLHFAGEYTQAEKVYRQAKTSSALLSFNLAVLLEDLQREDEATAAYREALAQDPHLYDAHFNLSRLHEKGGRPREALRHLLAYRRHTREAEA
jgi:tetratricopeptide (TPR) repeat protein